MTKHYQYIEGGSGGRHPELMILIRQCETFSPPELFEQEFDRSPNYIETPTAQPLKGADLTKAVKAKKDAYTAWAKKCDGLYKKGVPVDDHPPFTLTSPTPKKADKKPRTQEK